MFPLARLDTGLILTVQSKKVALKRENWKPNKKQMRTSATLNSSSLNDDDDSIDDWKKPRWLTASICFLPACHDSTWEVGTIRYVYVRSTIYSSTRGSICPRDHYAFNRPISISVKFRKIEEAICLKSPQLALANVCALG